MIRSRQFAFVIPLLLSIAPTHTALAQTTSSVKCDDGAVVTVSTGTGGGVCNQPPGVRLIECGDGAANQAIGGCDHGKARCGGIAGAASCNIARTSNMEPNGGTTTAENPQPATTGTINMEPITESNTTEPNGGPKTEGNPPTSRKPVISRTKKPRKIANKKGGDSSGSNMDNNNDQSSGGIKQLLDTLFR